MYVARSKQESVGGSVKKLLLVVGLLLAAGAVSAQQVTVGLVSFSGQGWFDGYPYMATINGGPDIRVMCDDYVHGGNPGDHWQANITNLGGNDYSLLRFNQLPDDVTLYKEAGWLLLETQVEQQSQWKDMNYAAWHIFDSNSPLDQGAQYWLMQAEQEAQGGFQGVDFTKVNVLTPVNQYDQDPTHPQELLTLDSVQGGTTPEPGTFILLGTGLLGLLGRKFLA